jgi:hypothetical protein
MTPTYLLTTEYEPQDTSAAVPGDERISIWCLPKLVWVSAALLITNVLVGIGMFNAPDIQADLYGHEVPAVSAASLKPSPFTPVVDTTKRKVQVAERLRPVFAEPTPFEPQLTDVHAAAALSLDIPSASKTAHQLDLPARTQNAVYEIPRSTYVNPERDRNHTLVN